MLPVNGIDMNALLLYTCQAVPYYALVGMPRNDRGMANACASLDWTLGQSTRRNDVGTELLGMHEGEESLARTFRTAIHDHAHSGHLFIVLLVA